MKFNRGFSLGFALLVLGGACMHDAFSNAANSTEQRVQQQGRRQGQARQGRGRLGRGNLEQGRQGRGRQRQDTNALLVGQMAPTFELMSLDGKSQFDLKELRGEKPVVLFFGSYT